MQREKNTQPDPRSPTSGGSSPKWGPQRNTRGRAPARQKPVAPDMRSARQRRGQSSQGVGETTGQAVVDGVDAGGSDSSGVGWSRKYFARTFTKTRPTNGTVRM